MKDYHLFKLALLLALPLMIKPSNLLAQAAPDPGWPDAATMLARAADGDASAASYTVIGCPDTDPWLRAVVDGLAALEMSNEQVANTALSWKRLLHCDDATIGEWFIRAPRFATEVSSGVFIAEGMLQIGATAQLEAIREAALNPAVGAKARAGLLEALMQKSSDMGFRTDLLFSVVASDMVPDSEWLMLEMGFLMAQEERVTRDGVVMRAASVVRDEGTLGRSGDPRDLTQSIRRNLIRRPSGG